MAAKYSNMLLVGLCIDRLSNSFNSFLGTPSCSANLLQFSKTSDRASNAKAISSKRPARCEGSSIFLDEIASLTNSESEKPAVAKKKMETKVNVTDV